MQDNSQNLTITTLANGATAQLRTLIAANTDRDLGRRMYVELRRLSYELAKKHEFEQKEGVKQVEANNS